MDVLVVGAGPAGATAARTLALGGVRVRIVDRYRFPRNKPCGGAISMRALRRFPYLSSALKRISTRLISRLRLQSPAGESVDLQSDTPAALMIRRVEFDELLVRLAQEAGAELTEDVEIVQVERSRDGVVVQARSGRRVRAPILIAADGANSVVAKRLNINQHWPRTAVALDMMEETPVEQLASADPDLLWVAYGYKQRHGYGYVFPKRRHVNVGVGFVLDDYRREVHQAPYQLHRAFVGELRREGILAGESSRDCFTPALIPVGGPLERVVHDRVMLVGDAGGFVNGFSAEGIYYAMVSGELAAHAVLRQQPAQLERTWRAEMGAELRDSVRVQRYLFHEPSRIDAMVRAARRHPRFGRLFVDYAIGHHTYGAAKARFVARFPLTAVNILWDAGLAHMS